MNLGQLMKECADRRIYGAQDIDTAAVQGVIAAEGVPPIPTNPYADQGPEAVLHYAWQTAFLNAVNAKMRQLMDRR